MHSGEPSHLGAALRLAAAGVRRRAKGSRGAPPGPARKLAVERRGITAAEDQLRRYLGATRGGDLELGGVLPPTYTAVWDTALALDLLAAESLPFPSQGIVHLASEIVVVRSLLVTERVRCRVEVERVEAHSRGAVLVLKSRLWNEAGHLAQENSTQLLIRGAERSGATGGGEAASEKPEREGAAAQWKTAAVWELPRDAGVRYARASGDYNPIHLWPWSSKLLGYPRPILHGHCALAMISNELTRACNRPPRRIRARFRAPIELPAEVRLDLSGEPGEGALTLRLLPGGGQGKPFVEGSWMG